MVCARELALSEGSRKALGDIEKQLSRSFDDLQGLGLSSMDLAELGVQDVHQRAELLHALRAQPACSNDKQLFALHGVLPEIRGASGS